MARVNLRALCLILFAFAAFAPTANAAVADGWIPVFDAADGVTVVGPANDETIYVRFGSRAAKLYRSLAGRDYTSGCFGSKGTSGMDVGRVPRKRGRVEISGHKGAEVCFVSTRLRNGDDSCVLTTTRGIAPGERPWCARVVVALNDAGRVFVDDFARASELMAVFFSRSKALAELQRAYGRDVVALATPDEAPPVGKVGFFDDGHIRVAAAMLVNGTKRFVRRDGDVFSTNVERLARDPEVLTLP